MYWQSASSVQPRPIKIMMIRAPAHTCGGRERRTRARTHTRMHVPTHAPTHKHTHTHTPFDDELYKVSGEGEDKYLIATSEQVQQLACVA